MKYIISSLISILACNSAFAYLRNHPIKFELSTEKETYYEGEKVTFLLTITNSSEENTYPVLLPHTQNTGQKLFYFNLYDKANNTLLLRASEEINMKMMVHDTGSVKIKYLKPKEQLVIPLFWNNFENYYNYHTQNTSHHSFGVPLFAGLYKINVHYNPKCSALGDSIYEYYNDFDKVSKPSSKLAMNENGDQSNFCELKIKKTSDSIISIEGIKYYTRWDKERHLCWYYTDSIGDGGSNIRLTHLTNLPVDSFTIKNEYFYSHFTNKFGEYVKRSDNGDIREYRKYRDECPEELLTERYNDFNQKTYYAVKLADGRFYNISYHQPSGKIHQEMYYSGDGTLCIITDYIYNKKDEFVKTKTTMTQPCIVTLDGKSYRIAEEL